MVVLDSSFLIGFYNDNDAHHPVATEAMDRFLAGVWGRGLLAEYVVVEVATVLAMRAGHAKAVEVIDLLLDSEQLDYRACSDLFPETFAAFRELSVSGLSFVDSALVALARRQGIESILSFDKGFDNVQGLRRLPEPA